MKWFDWFREDALRKRLASPVDSEGNSGYTVYPQPASLPKSEGEFPGYDALALREIERLQAAHAKLVEEVERLTALNEGGVRLENYVRDNAALRAELEKLTADRAELYDSWLIVCEEEARLREALEKIAGEGCELDNCPSNIARAALQSKG